MSAAVAPVATRCEVHDLPPRWWSSTICPHSHGLPRGRWPRENVPCKLDDILRFKSNSSPKGVYLPRTTRTLSFCEFRTTSIPEQTRFSLYKVCTGDMRWTHMCSYAVCLFVKNTSWTLEKTKSRRQKNNEDSPPRDSCVI